MIEQGTAEWAAARAGKATASRVADLTAKTKSGWGASRKNMIATLIAERLTGTTLETYTSGPMAWGIEQEENARLTYEMLSGNAVELIGFVDHPEIDWSGASPDGRIGTDGLIEIKCPNTATHLDTLRGAPIPEKYIKQMQWQMDCDQRDWCVFVSYDPRLPAAMHLHQETVLRDEKMIKSLRADVRSALDEVAEAVAELISKYGEQQ